MTAVRHLDIGYYVGPHSERLPETLFGDVGPRWLGAGTADRFGGEVSEASLGAMAHGMASRDSTRSLADPRREVQVVDLVFGAPKAVSIAALFIAGEHASHIVGAHRRAVAATMSYLEHHAVATARGDGGQRIAAHGLAAAGFTHGLSRGGDPHLHDHVMVANLVHGENGRFGPLDRRVLWAHRATAGALYSAHLRHELSSIRELSVSHRVGGSIGIAGIDVMAETALSTRAAEHREFGPSAPRDHKLDVADLASLRAQWQRRIDVLSDAAPLVRRDLSLHMRTSHLDERAFATALLGGDRPLTGRRVLAAWCEASRPGVQVSDALAAMTVLGVSVPTAPSLVDPAIAPRSVIASSRARGQFGPRPLDPTQLGAWVDLAQQLERREERGHHGVIETSVERRAVVPRALGRERFDGRG